MQQFCSNCWIHRFVSGYRAIRLGCLRKGQKLSRVFTACVRENHGVAVKVGLRIVSYRIVRKIVRIFKSPLVKKLVENVRRWFNSIDASFPPLKTVTLIKVCCAEWNLRLSEFFRVSNNLRRFLLLLEYRINCSTNNKNYRNISDSYICEWTLKISWTCYFS